MAGELMINGNLIPEVKVVNLTEHLVKRGFTVMELAMEDPDTYVSELRVSAEPANGSTVSEVIDALHTFAEDNSISRINIGTNYQSELYPSVFSVEYFGSYDDTSLTDLESSGSIIILFYKEFDGGNV